MNPIANKATIASVMLSKAELKTRFRNRSKSMVYGFLPCAGLDHCDGVGPGMIGTSGRAFYGCNPVIHQDVPLMVLSQLGDFRQPPDLVLILRLGRGAYWLKFFFGT